MTVNKSTDKKGKKYRGKASKRKYKIKASREFLRGPYRHSYRNYYAEKTRRSEFEKRKHN